MSPDSRLTLKAGTGDALLLANVTAAVADLTIRAAPDATPETQLLFGHAFSVHAFEGDWAYGAARNPLDPDRCDYVGWVRRSGLSDTARTLTHQVSALRAPVFSRADIKSPIRLSLSFASRISSGDRATGNGGIFHRVGPGFVSAKHLRPLDEVMIDFVDTAETFQGLPYVWGGNSAYGMDCSGLVKLALESAGHPTPRDADQQEAALGRTVQPDSDLMTLRRGDLVFWPGHVGIMQTSGRLLHANAHHMRVATEPLSDAVERIGPIRTLKRLPDYPSP